MKERIQYLDIIRIVATVGVLCNHIPLAAIHLFDKQATDIDRFLVNGNVHVMHPAVLLFVMVTGALLLQPERIIDYRKILTKYVWRMVVILALVGTAFAWMEIYFTDKHFALYQIPQALVNTLGGHTWKHMWYLYMLIGLYLITPLLKAGINQLSTKNLDWLIGIGFFFTSIIPAIQQYSDIEIGIKFPIASNYVFLMLLGYRLSCISLGKIRLWVSAIIIFIAIFMVFGYMEYVLGYMSLKWLSDYKSPIMILYSAIIFISIKELPYDFSRFLKKGGAKFSKDSFGIYVFHMLWVNIIYKVVKFNPIEHGLWTLIPVLVVVTLLTWGTTIIFRKIPYVGKYI